MCISPLEQNTMTISTQVNLETGTKSSNMMCEKSSQKTRKKLGKKERSERSKHERLKLSQLSCELKEKRKKDIECAKTEEEAAYLASLTTNEILLNHYRKQTGAQIFYKFKQWKDKGFSVNRNERAFRFWATPLRARSESKGNEHETQTTESNSDYFPTCCVFSDKQVTKIEEHHESHTATVSNETVGADTDTDTDTH